jgi:prepilin-type N-terminal cleavage/methylation domain-containing protein
MPSSGRTRAHPDGRGERGFTLIEILVATVIAGILFAAVAQMLMVYAKSVARAALRARTAETEQDFRRLQGAVVQAFTASGGSGYPSAGPWPVVIPTQNPIQWTRPAPGFDELGWAPSKSPVLLQYRVDGWATGFAISAVGDLNRDGTIELYRLWGDVGMYEGPLPYEPAGGK